MSSSYYSIHSKLDGNFTSSSINPQIWFGIETTLVALFTVEYIARCTAFSSTWTGLLKWMICASIPVLMFLQCLNRTCSILRRDRPTFCASLLHRNLDATRYGQRALLPCFDQWLTDTSRLFSSVSLSYECLGCSGYFDRFDITIRFYCEFRVMSVVHPSLILDI